jgi:hypothetical protein
MREIIYLGHDNEIDRVLKADGVIVPLDQVTRMQAKISSVTVDSEDSPNCFDWDTRGVNGIVELKLGGVAALADVKPANSLTLIVFDADHPSGIHWDTFPIKIVSI